MSSGKYTNLDSPNICWSLDGLEVKLKSLSHSPHKYLLSLLRPTQSVRQLPQQLKALWKETPMRIVKRDKKTVGTDPGELTHLFLYEYYCSHDFWSAMASRFLSCIWDWLFGVYLSLLAYLLFLDSLFFICCLFLFRLIWFPESILKLKPSSSLHLNMWKLTWDWGRIE